MHIIEQKKHSFTWWVVTLSSVGSVILIIAAICTPNLLRSRIAANESSAVGTLRAINTAAATYSQQHPGEGYPRNLSDLAPYVDGVTASGTKSGYSLRYRPEAPDVDGVIRGFKVEATPLTPGKGGTREFSSSESGVINFRTGPGGRDEPLGGEAPQPQVPAERPTP